MGIDSFWQWFEGARPSLEGGAPSESIGQALAERLAALGIGHWELGPDENGGMMLAVSACGDGALMPVVKEWISEAPTLPGWTFYSTKPPRTDWLQFHLPELGLSIDASDWRYALLHKDDGLFDVLIEMPGWLDLPEDQRDVLVATLLEGALGEIALYEHIGGWATFEKLPTKYETLGTDMPCLAEHWHNQLG